MALRTYRDWSVDVNPDAPASMFWQAAHPDYEAPGYDDGRPLVLSAATEQDLMVEIDCWHMDEDDADIATIQAAADALRSLAKRHGLTHAALGFHDLGHREFWNARGHAEQFVRSANSATIADAIPAMLAAKPFDTSERAAA